MCTNHNYVQADPVFLDVIYIYIYEYVCTYICVYIYKSVYIMDTYVTRVYM